MQNITLSAKDSDSRYFSLGDLAMTLEKVADPRDTRGRVYSLVSLLGMVILARLSGQDKPQAIFEWVRVRRAAFVELFALPKQQTPCLNTFRAILSYDDLCDVLEQLLQRYLYETYGGQTSRLISIDGKTMRGTIPKGSTQGVHLLSACLVEEDIVLKQVLVADKQNEISAGPQLLEGLPIAGKVLCADAMQTQRTFCTTVLANGGNYILWAKENQPTLLADIKQFFVVPRQTAGWHKPALPHTVVSDSCKGHGRIEKRTLTAMKDEDAFLQWPGVKQVFKLERSTKEIRSGKEKTTTVYGLTSCDGIEVTAKQLLQWTRAYWGIENGLHYRRDVTLHEDATRISSPKIARAIAVLNNFVIGLTRKLGYRNLASARRHFDASIARQLVF